MSIVMHAITKAKNYSNPSPQGSVRYLAAYFSEGGLRFVMQ